MKKKQNNIVLIHTHIKIRLFINNRIQSKVKRTTKWIQFKFIRKIIYKFEINKFFCKNKLDKILLLK